MPNWCETQYVITGNRRQVNSLYRIMKNLQERKTSLLENGFGTTWLGNLVHRLGANPSKVYCRGDWSNLVKHEGYISFDCEHAWSRPDEVEELIREKYDELDIYFITEELGMDIFQTNDEDGIYFKERVIIDGEDSGMEYYTEDEALKALSEMLGEELTSWEDAEDAVTSYNHDIDFKVTDNERIWLHRAEFV